MRRKEVKKKEKKERKELKNKIGVFVWWMFWIIYLEMIYRIFVIGDFWSFNTLSVIEFCVPLIIINTILTTLFSEKANRIITAIFSTILAVLLLAQIVYFNFYHSRFSFFSLIDRVTRLK